MKTYRDDAIRLLHILPRATCGGPGYVVLSLLKCLDRRRYDVAVCSISPPEDRMVHLLADLDVPCINLNSQRFLDLLAIARMARVMRSGRTVIAHTHGLRPDWFGRLAARLAGVPFVFSTVHNEDDKCYMRDYGYSERATTTIDSINRLTAQWADRLVAVSSEVERYLIDRQRVPAHKVTMIPNGIDLSEFPFQAGVAVEVKLSLGIPPGDLVIGTVAQLRPAKGMSYLVQAAQQVVLAYANVVFLLIGSGPQERQLRQSVQEAGLEEHFLFVGQRQDVPRLLAGIDVFVLPSLWEGMPLSLLEAMAVGRACIVTNIGGCREVVEHGQTGIVIPPGDPEALAQAILRLLEDTILRFTLGQAARQRIELKYSAEAMSRSYDSLYQNLIASERVKITDH